MEFFGNCIERAIFMDSAIKSVIIIIIINISVLILLLSDILVAGSSNIQR